MLFGCLFAARTWCVCARARAPVFALPFLTPPLPSRTDLERGLLLATQLLLHACRGVFLCERGRAAVAAAVALIETAPRAYHFHHMHAHNNCAEEERPNKALLGGTVNTTTNTYTTHTHTHTHTHTRTRTHTHTHTHTPLGGGLRRGGFALRCSEPPFPVGSRRPPPKKTLCRRDPPSKLSGGRKSEDHLTHKQFLGGLTNTCL